MPHVVFNLGNQVATADVAISARRLIHGIEPGLGRRLDEGDNPMRPALLIQDAWIEVNSAVQAQAQSGWQSFFLKLSQEQSLDPGLILPVGSVHGAIGSGAAQDIASAVVDNYGHKLAGEVFVPEWVGVRTQAGITFSALDVDVHLVYAMITLPWMEWFLRYEWIDGIVNNTREW